MALYKLFKKNAETKMVKSILKPNIIGVEKVSYFLWIFE